MNSSETHITELATEKHYTPQEAADFYSVSVDTIYRWFRNEPGVMETGNDETLHKRKKKMLRIPHSVLVRFHEKHRTDRTKDDKNDR